MTFSVNAVLVSFLLACAVYFLFSAAVDFFVKDPPANANFKGLLLFVCLAIAIIGGFFVKL